MMRLGEFFPSAVVVLGVFLVMGGVMWSTSRADGPAAAAPATKPSEPSSALDFTAKDIDGKDVDLAGYRGKVMLVVNVASKCGNTPQYAGLEKIYEKYKDQGLVILGFPANNFGQQEPGTNDEIKTFCSSKYDVTFPMFAKISVKGSDAAPMYQFLTRQKTAPQPAGDITWNFEKFLIGRNGQIIARYAPKTQPTDEKMVQAIEAELNKTKQ